jgi:RNA polymerase sigma-70 factor (ECF subfamily)
MTNDTRDHPSPPEDDDLVERARMDRAAFGCLFDRYYPRVLRYCLRRLNDRAVAEDVTSEVFLQAAANLREFAGRREVDFRRWLFRVATNGVMAHFRKAGRRQEILEAAAREGRFDRNPGGEGGASDWPEIHAALLELDEREQTIVSLRFFAELSHEEIASVVDSTAGAVRTALSRTLARLRERFDPSHRAPGGG